MPHEIKEAVEIIKSGILRMREPCYGQYDISELRAEERARNIVACLVGAGILTYNEE